MHSFTTLIISARASCRHATGQYQSGGIRRSRVYRGHEGQVPLKANPDVAETGHPSVRLFTMGEGISQREFVQRLSSRKQMPDLIAARSVNT